MTQNKKSLTFWMCVALVVGNMIGSGIFLLPASLAQYGGISLLGWCFTAAGAFFVALVFVRLSRRQHALGGPYAYTRDELGPLAGFVVAWGYWVSTWCGNAAIAIGTVSYLSVFFPALNAHPALGLALALFAVWLLTLINCLGVREAGTMQLVTTILKVIPLFIIGLAVFLYFDQAQFVPLNLSTESNFDAITATAALTLWAFLGLESATIPADNIQDAERTIPKATLLGFLIAALIYISCTATILSVVPQEQLVSSAAPFADAAKILWGDWAAYLIAATAVVSSFGALNGWILIQGQIPMAMANDGAFPKAFKANKKGVPVFGLILSSVLVSIVTVSNYAGSLVGLFTFSILLATSAVLVAYLFSSLAEMNWLRKQGQFVSILKWFVPIIALAYVIWALSGVGQKAILVGLGLMLLGVPIYYVFVKRDK